MNCQWIIEPLEFLSLKNVLNTSWALLYIIVQLVITLFLKWLRFSWEVEILCKIRGLTWDFWGEQTLGKYPEAKVLQIEGVWQHASQNNF